MKILKKINKGLILTVIVLIALAIYLLNLESSRNAEKAEIKNACQAYIDFVNKYSMLDSKYRSIDKSMTDADYNKYIQDMKSELSNIFVDDEKLKSNQTDIVKANLDSQLVGNFVITDLDRKISEYKKFVFNANNVTVQLSDYVDVKYLTRSEAALDVKTGKYTGNAETQKQSTSLSDSISLQKVNGKWKVVYANINLPIYNQKITNGKVVGM